MSKTIVMWGVILCGCVCGPQTLQASSLEWEDGCQQIQLEAQTMLAFAPTRPQFFDDLLLVQSSPETVVVTTHRFQLEALKITEANVSVLTLPESGTLLLLGLGLAGLASLMRKKKGSS